MQRRLVLKFAVRLVLALIALPFIYFALALVGGLVPVNWGWQPPERGVTVFVRTNGVHTWIMMPAAAAGVDWRPLAPAAHIREPARAGAYLAFGYGNRDFYLNTPTWSDLSLPTALAAAFGQGPGLVHVEHEPVPRADADHRPIRLTVPQYRKLAAHIGASFEFDAAGRTKPLLGRGYGPTDIFYEARGSYNAHRTCNEWTGEALRETGVRMGLWTPFSQSVMLRF